MQNPLANFINVFSLVRDDRGFQVNPLCRHDITSPFPPSGNGGYVRNLDDNSAVERLIVFKSFKSFCLHLYCVCLLCTYSLCFEKNYVYTFIYSYS